MKLNPDERMALFFAMALGIVVGAILGYILGPLVFTNTPAMLNIITGATLGLCAAVFLLFGVWKPEIMERERARTK